MKILFDQEFPEIKMGSGWLTNKNGNDFIFYPAVKLTEYGHVVPYREEAKFLEAMGAVVELNERGRISIITWVHMDDPKTLENIHVRVYSADIKTLVILKFGEDFDIKRMEDEYALHLKSKAGEEDKELKRFLKEYTIIGQKGDWGLKMHSMNKVLHCITIGRNTSLGKIKEHLALGVRFCDSGPVDAETRQFTMVPTKYEWKRIEDLSLKHLISIVECLCDQDSTKYTDLKTVFENKDMRNKLDQRISDLTWLERQTQPLWWVVENPRSGIMRGGYSTKGSAIDDHSYNRRDGLVPVVKRFRMIEVADE
jgi:hypothetical protein